jgi:hypothetical protein
MQRTSWFRAGDFDPQRHGYYETKAGVRGLVRMRHWNGIRWQPRFSGQHDQRHPPKWRGLKQSVVEFPAEKGVAERHLRAALSRFTRDPRYSTRENLVLQLIDFENQWGRPLTSVKPRFLRGGSPGLKR